MFALAWASGRHSGCRRCSYVEFLHVFPEVGANFGLVAFVVVALGGFGSVAGAFIAGIIVGLVEVLGGYLMHPL